MSLFMSSTDRWFHSSCRAVQRSGIVLGGGWRATTRLHNVFQACFIGFFKKFIQWVDLMRPWWLILGQLHLWKVSDVVGVPLGSNCTSNEHDACPHLYCTTTKLIPYDKVPGKKLCSRLSPDKFMTGIMLKTESALWKVYSSFQFGFNLMVLTPRVLLCIGIRRTRTTGCLV